MSAGGADCREAAGGRGQPVAEGDEADHRRPRQQLEGTEVKSVVFVGHLILWVWRFTN